MMKKSKLTVHERTVEKDLVGGVYVAASHDEYEAIAHAIHRRKKDAVLNIRVNQEDLKNIKRKAHKLGVRYQTFIAEVLHRVAM